MLRYATLWQLLATRAKTKGLDLIEGVVKPLKSADAATRIPHVGWNEIDTFQADLARIMWD